MEFKSKLEELMPAVELNFQPTPGFGRFKRFLSHAIAHPAKMNTNLLDFLIKAYTKPGDTILDPMCGSGSTGVVAALHGRNAIQVDIEQKFIDWAEKAKRRVEASPIPNKGRIVNILGDSRKLSQLLTQKTDVAVTSLQLAKTREMPQDTRDDNIANLPHGEINAIVTSPPYSNVASSKEGAISPHMQGLISKLSGIPVKEFAHDVEKLKEAVKIAQSKIPFKYSDSEDNIGNLSHGDIDIILTSPPYGEAQEGAGIAKRGYQGSKHSPPDLVGKRSYTPDKFENSENISKLPMGNIDIILTSPPYSDTYLGGGDPKRRRQRLIEAGHNPKDFLGGKARNAVLKHYK